MNELITVYSAEVMRRLRSRTFMIGLAFGILGIAAMMELPRFFTSYEAQSNRILLAGDPQLVAAARPLLHADFTIAGERRSTAAPTLAELQARKASAVVAILRASHGVRVILYAKDPSALATGHLRRDLAPLNLQLASRLQPKQIQALMQVPVQTHSVASKFGTAEQADAAKIIAYVLLLLLYILIMVNSQLIMSSVAEEKTSRIAELLVASVNPSALLAGKVLASATLAIAQMIIWVGIAYALGAQPAPPGGAAANGAGSADFSLNGVSSMDIAGFVLFFLIGFLQTSTLFAAVGSLINRTEDLGSISGPLFLPVVAAFIIAISALAVPESPAVVITSFVPLIAPFVMFARIVVSSVPLWQVAASLAINIAAIVAIAVIGGRIYRVGMLLYGRPPRPSQIWHAIRQ
ncbi:MAG TPA: ABC transporter permease [Candidatus Baltobacteraceae bacterium]|nr:ABC transporter permease [Candidatus Baltobacteraceae bacterium]